jgi:integrase
MSTLNEIITFELESEHDFEHELEYNLTQKPQFSTPKIYNAKGDLSKRWYVYYSYRNPLTNKLVRQQNIYGQANQFKFKEDRFALLAVYRRRLIKLLKAGYNPYIDNTDFYYSTKDNESQKGLTTSNSKIGRENIPTSPIANNSPTPIAESKVFEEPKMTLQQAFDFSLKLKEKVVAERTLKDYTGRAKKLITWVKKKHPEVMTIDQLNKKVISLFLHDVLSTTSPRNYNNFRTDFSSLMQTLEDNDIIKSNPVKKIKALKTNPQRNKTYSLAKQTEIFDYLEVNDPVLLLFIKFISYNFLRPIEACRIRIKDINLEENTIQFVAKNSPLKTKRIPEILLKDLPDLSGLDGDLFLFTPDKIGGTWDTTEDNKRDYFSKRYKKVVKDHFQLGKNYGLYSFRHTFITKLYRALVKDSSPHEAKSRLMLITGHSTMSALEKYLRDIDAAIADDYSHLL